MEGGGCHVLLNVYYCVDVVYPTQAGRGDRGTSQDRNELDKSYCSFRSSRSSQVYRDVADAHSLAVFTPETNPQLEY